MSLKITLEKNYIWFIEIKIDFVFISDYAGKSLPNLIPKLKSLLFLEIKTKYKTKKLVGINKITSPHEIMCANPHYIHSANSKATTEITLI